MSRLLLPLLLTIPLARGIAQTPAAVPPAPPAAPPSVEMQIAAAVSTLPTDLRAGATVMGYGAEGKLVVIRKGTGDMICLGHNPKDKEFHVACYHSDMEPFMARGRELRASGITGGQVDTVRFKEVKEGKLLMNRNPSAMYQLFGGAFDPVKKEVTGAQSLYVVYIPFATGKSTGLPEKPFGKAPWVMFPGTPKAHMMFTPGM